MERIFFAMAEFCRKCGVELPPESIYCPNCGADVQAELVMPTTRKKLKWWMVVAPVVLAVTIAIALLWKPIYVRMAPTAVLSKAWETTVADLSTRSDGTLWTLLDSAYDDSLTNTMEMSGNFTYDGVMTLDMSATTMMDGSTSQCALDSTWILSADGVANELQFDLGMYLDQEILVLNILQVTGTDYYGICFDTFGEDVRQNELIYGAIGEDNLTMAEEIVNAIAESLRDTTEMNEDGMPQWNEEYAAVLMHHISDLKPSVVAEKIDVDGTVRKAYKITYDLVSAETGSIMLDILDIMEDDNFFRRTYEAYPEFDANDMCISWEAYIQDMRTKVEERMEEDGGTSVSFYLYNDKIVAMDVTVDDGESFLTMEVILGENPGSGDILVAMDYENEEETGSAEIWLTTVGYDDTVRESCSIELLTEYRDGDRDQVSMTFGYEWDKVNGDFEINFYLEDDEEVPLDISLDWMLYAEENGFTLEIPDLMADIASLREELQAELEGMHFRVVYSLYPGAEIKTPSYRNIGEVTQETLYQMLLRIYENYSSVLMS